LYAPEGSWKTYQLTVFEPPLDPPQPAAAIDAHAAVSATRNRTVI
jgi:hypothetical protein